MFRHASLPWHVILFPMLMVPAVSGTAQEQAHRDRLRQTMVNEHIERRGVRDTATLRAMRTVPRHEFVPPELVDDAYRDTPLPIGYGQTISQPYIVGYMTEKLAPRAGMRILEIGTGSAYQAAVLAEAGAEVRTIEIIQELATAALARLRRLGYDDVQVRHADGYFGWPEAAPFDAIIVTAAAGFIPPPLIEQLRPGGKLIIPVGSVYGVQNLVLVNKAEDGTITTETLLPVRFVPLLRWSR